MKQYIQYSGKQFERMLWIIKKELSLKCYIKEINDELKVFNDKPVWEKVYAIPTHNENIRLIIFSSVDKITDKIRPKGTDAVRLVLEVKNKKDIFYHSVHKHLRINTLKENMKASIQYITNNVDSIHQKIS